MDETDKKIVVMQMKFLYKIGNEEGFVIEGKPNKNAYKIGEILNEMGGLELMQHSAKQVTNLIQQKEGKIMDRELEHCWNGIGDWIA